MNEEISAAVIIIARNEEKNISKTLECIIKQKLKPYRIIVVNDGSTDKTAEIISKFDSVELINRPVRQESYLAKKELAETFNTGLKKLKNDLKCQYVCLTGSDTLYSENYLKDIILRMEKNPNLVIASGIIENEFSIEPRGAGRVIKCDFWRKIGFSYPQNYGFEGYLLLKANSLGYKTTSFQDIISTTQRKTGFNFNPKTYYFYGLGYKALGYTTLYVLGKVLLFGRKSPKSALYILKGYFSDYDNLYEKELRDYVRKTQSNGKLKFDLIKRFFKILSK